MIFYPPGWASSNGHITGCFSKIYFGSKEVFSIKVLLHLLLNVGSGAGYLTQSLSALMCKMGTATLYLHGYCKKI